MPTDLPKTRDYSQREVEVKRADMLAKLKAFRAASRSELQRHADMLIDALEPPKPETTAERLGNKLGALIIWCFRAATWFMFFYSAYHFTGKYW